MSILRNGRSRVSPSLSARRLLRTTATRASPLWLDLTERKRAEVELRESEQNYRCVRIEYEGFCPIEVLFDDNEKPVDSRFLQVSPSFELADGIIMPPAYGCAKSAPQHETIGSNLRQESPHWRADAL